MDNTNNEVLSSRGSFDYLFDECEIIDKETEQMVNKVKKLNLNSPIKLNVGGTVFTTTISTLTSSAGNDSFFDSFFSDGCEDRLKKNGEYYIDRDPSCFGRIIEFLRSGTLDMGKINKSDREQLLAEAEYYNISKLCMDIRETFDVLFRGPGYGLQMSGRIAYHLDGGDAWVPVLGPIIENGKMKAIKILSCNNGQVWQCKMMIGLAPPYVSIGEKESTEKAVGFYFKASNTTLFAPRLKISNRQYLDKLQIIVANSIIGVKLSMDNKVSFVINGKEGRTAFTVPTGAEYRLVVLLRSGTSFELSNLY